MIVLTRDTADTMRSRNGATVNEEYIRVGDVLQIHRAHFPGDYARLHSSAQGVYDCRVLRQGDIKQFYFRGDQEWANYLDILDTFEARRIAGSTGHTTLLPPDVVFAPMKIVIAERDEPIRAVLTFDPVYPRRGKAALLHPGQSLWMAYAALAVLNSAIGQALYRADLKNREGRLRAVDGVSLKGLERLPVARVGFKPELLESVANLAYQMEVLHQIQQEDLKDLQDEIDATYERLRWGTRDLLGYSTEDAEELIKSVLDLDIPENSGNDNQMKLFKDPWQLPPHPPVDLLTINDEVTLKRLEQQRTLEALPFHEETKLGTLQRLQYWDHMLKIPLSRELPADELPLEETEPAPFYIEDIRGAQTPVQLVSEVHDSEAYEYYPIGQYVVAAPGVCGGRATFKLTRIDLRHLLRDLENGKSGAEISSEFGGRVPPEAVEEARLLASQNSPEVFERPLLPKGAMIDHS